jgi:hypothetical protein
MTGDNMTEEEIAGIFDRVAQDLTLPGAEAVIDGAERHGRRLRARRRAFLGAGSALAVTAVIVAAVAGPRLASGQRAGSHRGGLTTPASTSVPTQGAAATPLGAARAMADLKAMLPAGSAVTQADESQDPVAGTQINFTYDDGGEPVDFYFAIVPGGSDGPANPGDLLTACAGALPQSCTKRTLPDGDVEIDQAGAGEPAGSYSMKVDLVKADGLVISLWISGRNPDGKPLTRTVSPGSFAGWNAVAQSPDWSS